MLALYYGGVPHNKSGHGGQETIYQKVASRYFWENYYADHYSTLL